MKFLILVITFITTGTVSLMAQQDAYQWRVGAYSGLMTYYGDLNRHFFSPDKAIKEKTLDALSYGISLEKSLSQSWSTKVLYTNGKFYANDRAIRWNGDAAPTRSYYERSLNARTDIQDLSLMFTYYFDNDRLLRRRAFISPYFNIGLGITNFEVFGDLFDETGNRYYYWSDESIRNEPENSASGDNAVIITQDGKYETNLTDLHTEQKYRNTVFNIPVGVGLKFRLNSRVNLNLEYTARYAFTDYLDDVSGIYRQDYDNVLQAYAANPTNLVTERRGDSGKHDVYSFVSVSLHYNFIKKRDSYIAPRIYPSQGYAGTSVHIASDIYEEDKRDNLDGSSNDKSNDEVHDFYPIPSKPDSLTVISRAGVVSNDFSSDSIGSVISHKNIQSPLDKYRLQDDTIRQLEYEVKKLKLEKELYELRKSSADFSVRKRNQTDTVMTSASAYSTNKLAVDSISAKRAQAQLTKQQTNAMAPLTPDTSAISRARFYALPDNGTPLIVSTDTASVNNIQRELNTMKTLLKDRNNNVNQSPEEKAAIAQLQSRVDALSYELRNRQPVTRVIERSVSPSSQTTADNGAILAMINLERRMNLLSNDVNNTASTNKIRDSLTLRSMESSAKTEAALSKKIDSLNSRLQASALEQDSIKQIMVVSERDSLKAQVSRLQESLQTLKSQKPDTVERRIVTIPKLPKTEVFFKVNSSVLSASDNSRIREVANIIEKYPKVQVIIRGFTDKTGSVKTNLMLSEKRASAVEQVLIAANISSERIVTESNGVDGDLTNKSSQYGRRVEIILSTVNQPNNGD